MKLSPCAGSLTGKAWSECFHCIRLALQGWKWNSKAARVAQDSIISAPEKVRKRQRSESNEPGRDGTPVPSAWRARSDASYPHFFSSHVTCHSRKSANDLRGCIGAADFVTRKNSVSQGSLGLRELTKLVAARWLGRSSPQPQFSPKNFAIVV